MTSMLLIALAGQGLGQIKSAKSLEPGYPLAYILPTVSIDKGFSKTADLDKSLVSSLASKDFSDLKKDVPLVAGQILKDSQIRPALAKIGLANLDQPLSSENFEKLRVALNLPHLIQVVVTKQGFAADKSSFKQTTYSAQVKGFVLFTPPFRSTSYQSAELIGLSAASSLPPGPKQYSQAMSKFSRLCAEKVRPWVTAK